MFFEMLCNFPGLQDEKKINVRFPPYFVRQAHSSNY